MAQRPEEQPDELGELRKRLGRLERKVESEAAEARLSWQGAVGLAVGAVVLFLSLALPWMRLPMRDTRGFEARFSLDPAEPLHLGEPRTFVTGWEMWGAALLDHRAVLLAFLALAVLGGLAVAAFISTRRWLFTATQGVAFLPPLLFLTAWPTDPETSVGAGPGPVVAVAACLVIGMAATRGKPDSW